MHVSGKIETGKQITGEKGLFHFHAPHPAPLFSPHPGVQQLDCRKLRQKLADGLFPGRLSMNAIPVFQNHLPPEANEDG
jgi:hypothetical protein